MFIGPQNCAIAQPKGVRHGNEVGAQVAEEAGRQTRALLQQHEQLKADLRSRSGASERRHAPRRNQVRPHCARVHARRVLASRNKQPATVLLLAPCAGFWPSQKICWCLKQTRSSASSPDGLSTQELEQQLADVRAHYQRKVRGLQMQLDTASGHPPAGSGRGGGSGGGSVRHEDAQQHGHDAVSERAGVPVATDNVWLSSFPFGQAMSNGGRSACALAKIGM